MHLIARTIDLIQTLEVNIDDTSFVDRLLSGARSILGFDEFSLEYVPEDRLVGVYSTELKTIGTLFKATEDGTCELISLIPSRESDHSVLRFISRKVVSCRVEFRICMRLITSTIYHHMLMINPNEIDHVRQSQLATLGEFTAGIMHEIANPATIIKGITMRLKKSIQQDKADKSLLEASVASLDHATQQITNIIKTVKTFSYTGKKYCFEPARIADIIRSSSEMIQWSTAGKRITIRVEEFDNNLTLECVPSRLAQVLINLLTNARDALSEFSTAREKCITIDTYGTESFVFLSVKDNGPGIPLAVKKRMFERFFTTKPLGQGNGLGLPLCKEVVEEHGGTIALETSAEGTHFLISLPKKQPKITDAAA